MSSQAPKKETRSCDTDIFAETPDRMIAKNQLNGEFSLELIPILHSTGSHARRNIE